MSEQCDGCGYTLKDEILHRDHFLCQDQAPWQALYDDKDSDEFREALAAAINDAPYGWEEHADSRGDGVE